jgi:proline dehydrogenase
MASLLGRAVLGITEREAIRRAFTRSGPGRRLATRFVAGETMDDAVAVTRRLNEAGMTVSMDHLGEHVHDREPAVSARDDYLACLDRIATEGLDANISIKLTQLGLGFDDVLAAESLDLLARRAADAGTTVTVDMEESRHTQATIDMYTAAQARFGNLGIAVQTYLLRTASDLDRLIPLGGHIRLCKGAYAEPADVAFQAKREVDTSFARLLRILMAAEGTKPAIATHDGDLIDLGRSLANGRSGPYEFQMLYGIRSRLQQELVAGGHPLRIYVPYGKAWYPYLTRRLAERPANLAFFLRAAAGR